MQTTAILAATLTAVTAQYGAAPVPPVAEVPAASYSYADYDNIVVASPNALWYSSSVSADAQAAATGNMNAAAGSWSQAKSLNIDPNSHYNLKGAAFCGGQDESGKYNQLFVAESGNEQFPSAVYGWKVQASSNKDEGSAVQLVANSKWTVYQQANSNVTDVECGPKGGLFIADKGNNGIYWVTGADLVAAQNTPAYQTVVPPNCGAAVAEVRSLSWNAQQGLVWTNNAAAPDASAAAVPDASAGVFQYGAVTQAVDTAQCSNTMCDAWSSQCSSAIKQVEAPAAAADNSTAAPQYWAVSQAWGSVQVSQGDKAVYDTASNAVVANVPGQATYSQVTDQDRSALLVADQQQGAVYAVKQNNAQPQQIAQVNGAYGVAYNAHGAVEGSASTLALSFGAVLAVAALFF